MADVGIEQLKEDIQADIKANNNQTITGDLLQERLIDTVDTLKGYTDDHVSVSQNTETGHTDITVGDTTIPVASAEEIEQLKSKLHYQLGDQFNAVRGSYGYQFNSLNLVADSRFSIFVINVSPGDVMDFTTAGDGYLVYAILASVPDFDANQDIDLSSYLVAGGSRVATNTTAGKHFTIPADGVAIVLQGVASINPVIDRTPSSIMINGNNAVMTVIDSVRALQVSNKTNTDNIAQLDGIVKGTAIGFKLNGDINSILTPNSSIVLSTEGDSLIFEFDEIGPQDSMSGGYAFSLGQSDVAFRGVAVGKDVVAVRTDDGTWVALDIPFTGMKKLSIKYENGITNVYGDDAIIASYAGQKTITIRSFGNGVVPDSPSIYWSGKISKIIVNGAIQGPLDFTAGQNVNYYIPTSGTVGQNAGMFVKKTASTLSVYCPITNNYYIHYPLNYRYLAYQPDTYPSYFDNWGIGRPSLCLYDNGVMTEIAYLFYTAEAELAISLQSGAGNANVYVGGSAHGFENIITADGVRHIMLLIDNQRVAENAVFDLQECCSVEVYQESELCQAYTNTNPFAKAFKRWNFKKDGLTISTSLSILRSLAFAAAQFGMMGVYRHWGGADANNYLTNRMIKDNTPFKIFDVSDGWESIADNNPLRFADKECKKITAYGERSLGFALAIESGDTKENGGMFVATNSSVYNKIYFDLTGVYTPEINEVLTATQKWTIE